MPACNSSATFISEIKPTVQIITSIYFTILSPAVIVLNLSLIASFIATKQVRINSSNFLIICISCADLLNGLVVMPLLAIYLHSVKLQYSDYGCIYVDVTFFLMYLLVSVGLIWTMLMALDRYIHMNPNIERPSRLRKIFKQPYLSCMVVILCLLCVAYSSFNTFSAGKSGVTISIAVAAGFIWFLITIPCLYIRGYLRVRKFTRNNLNESNDVVAARKAACLKRLSKTVLILISLAYFSTLPFAVSNIAYLLVKIYGNKSGLTIVEICWHVTGCLTFVNSMSNSLVIFMRNKKSREWVKGVLRCKKGSNNRRRGPAKLTMDKGHSLEVIGQRADKNSATTEM